MSLEDGLIPRQIIFSDPEKLLAKISPDGNFISYLAPVQNNLNLWIVPIEDLSQAKPVTFSEHPLKDYWWANTNDHLLYIHDHFGDENWQLKAYQLSTQRSLSYTKQGLQARIFHISWQNPTKILIGLNDRDKRFHDAYVLDILTGGLTLAYQNQEYWDILADDNLNVRLALKVKEKTGEYVDITQAAPRLILTLPLHDLFSQYFYAQLRPCLSSEGETLYLSQSVNSNTSTLSAIGVENRNQEDLGYDVKADIFDILYDKKLKKPIAYATNYERKRWHALNRETQEHFDILGSIDNGDIDAISQTADNQKWVVSFIHDNGPVNFYHYDCHNKKVKFLFNSHQAFETYSFTRMHPRVITTRDGTQCVSYLSLPARCRENEKGVPSKSVPLILLVHGGPNFRDFWGFNPTHQWLANRGYAVLSVNYRASTGFGKAHFAAGYGEWAGKIQEDLLDAIEWAISEKITTRDTVAIMGRSFGGYATLVGLAMTPDVFACGVDIVGPSNLVTLAEHFPPYWKAMKGAIHEMLGCDPDTPEGREYLIERSPLFYAKNIKKPLIIGHGANDVRVMQSESDALVAAMQANGIPVTYAVFPDEGHQFMHPGNRMAFYALVEAFLAKSLHGKVEDFDNTVHTTMDVRVDDFALLE